MKMYQTLLQWIQLFTVVVASQEIEFHGNRFTNMEVYDGKIYIGAANYIVVLNANNLNNEDTVSTCTGMCFNINKVLLINERVEQLITCGTGHGGICEIRNLSNIDNVLSQSRNDSFDLTYLVVSTNEKRPAAFVIASNTNALYTGVTYGPGMYQIIQNNSVSYNYYYSAVYYNYYLAKFKLDTNAIIRSVNGILNLDLHENAIMNVEDYLVYFKAVFKHHGFIYFLTNQKFKVGEEEYSSKIIRVCENDTEFFSYTDILLKCEKQGISFNLVQDVSVLQPSEDLGIFLNTSSKIIAATFVAGSDPEQPDGASAVCLYAVEEIDRKIMEAKQHFITCEWDYDYLLPKEKYLQDLRGGWCLNILQAYYNDSWFNCKQAVYDFMYIIGDEASAMSGVPVYSSSTPEQNGYGYFTKVQAFLTGNHTVMHIGTSRGYLLKMNVNSDEAYLYQQKAGEDGHPITGIRIEEEGKIEYVMSSNKIVRYETEESDCSMYTTCEETMGAKNPLCGWCVYESRSTFNENSSCPYQSFNGHWLSSLSKCLSLVVEPRGIRVGKIERVEARLTDVLPEFQSGDKYRCAIEGNLALTDLLTSHSPFTCQTPYIAAHTEGKAQIFVVHKNSPILLAETDFLFYDCQHYKRCSECTGDARAKCAWDSINTLCLDSNVTENTSILEPNRCPQFRNSRDVHYLPSGVSKELSFNVANLLNSSDTKYACRLKDTQVEANRVGDDQIKCILQEIAENVVELEYEIEILYGTSMLDNKNTVIVYNCGQLGSDCSVCRSLKRMHATVYECDWCSGSCIYSVNQCVDACDPPTITKVVPRTAALNGNISVTIYGTELGSVIEEVQSINLAGVLCEISQDIFKPSRRVVCIAGASSDVVSGNVIVVTNNKTSSGNVSFSYKMPVIEEFLPIKGPMAGGTRLTITGTDLGVGGRNVKVVFRNSDREHKECTYAKVMPDLLLGSISSVPFHIECDSPPGKVDTTLEKMEVVFDGATAITLNSTFTYLDNPVVKDIMPREGIASGGNRLTITGRYLNNAYKGHMMSNKATTVCILNNQTEITCTAPELSLKLKEELYNREGSPSDTSLMTESVIHLDGVTVSYSISYYVDPVFYNFSDDQIIQTSNQEAIHILGKNLNIVAGEDDVTVTIGDATCEVIRLSENNITCLPPPDQPAPSIPDELFPEVNVSIGNVHSTVGYVRYVIVDVTEDITTIKIAASVSSSGVIIVIVAVFLVMYKKKANKIRKSVEQDIQMKQIQQEGTTTDHDASKSPTAIGVDEDTQLVLQKLNLLIDRQCLQLGDLLGTGHFGSVFKGNLLAEDKTTLVAVKTLHQNCPREIDVQAFLDEALIMKDFKHPRVLSLIGICLGMDTMPLVVLPYVPHGDLLSFVKDDKNNLSIRDVINYGIDISEGMAYLSNLKFVHRDLAARNCMLDEMFHVKVADFGLSRDIYETNYYTSDNKKTVLPVKWMALECLEKGKYTSKSDVWSFGIVMWELFTRGTHPYPDVDNWDIIRYLKNGRRLPQPQLCPIQIYKMMRNCWLPDPNDRPAFPQIEQTIKDIIAILEQDMKQGVQKATIENTYVNIDNCTEYIFTDEMTPPPAPDGDGYLSAKSSTTALSDANKTDTG